MCCHNLLSLWGTTETQLRAGTTPSGTRPRPLRFALQAQNFSAIWLHPKLTQKEFHKPGRYYQDKVNAAWSTVPSGGVGCIASSPTAPGKENILHFFPWLTPGLGTSFSWASLCLKISFPYVLASTKVWPGPAAHQAEMGFWQCHVCSWVLWSLFLLRAERQHGENRASWVSHLSADPLHFPPYLPSF